MGKAWQNMFNAEHLQLFKQKCGLDQLKKKVMQACTRQNNCMRCSQTLILQQNGKTCPRVKQLYWGGSLVAWEQLCCLPGTPKLSCWSSGGKRGEEGTKTLVLAEIGHPGWVKLAVESLSASQRDDEFSERSDAVLWLTSTSLLQPKCLQNILLCDNNFPQMLEF